MDRIFGIYINADNLQGSAHTLLDLEGLIECRAEGDALRPGDRQVDADRDPSLGLHSVFAQVAEDHAKPLVRCGSGE